MAEGGERRLKAAHGNPKAEEAGVARRRQAGRVELMCVAWYC